ncbi:MAG: TIGR01212 family radical SAM protein [Desulfobulbus sp.]|nr:TIGR01212 family radical SAM protein [Desulfobulbus sp.]
MEPPRIWTFSLHCRKRYGRPVGKIPLDLGYPCPNRALGGCIFCRPASFTPQSLRADDAINLQIQRGKQLLIKGRFRHYLAYFQQETCTALATDQLLPILRQVLSDPDCLGLILSTRPDAIASDLPFELSRLVKQSGKDCLIELGLQTWHQRSLTWLNRNHSYNDFLQAVDRLARFEHLQIGVHLILGIPGESAADMHKTLYEVCRLPIHALKLHHLQVIRDTVLHTLYERGKVPVFSLSGYMELLLTLLPQIPQSITIHRLWASSHPELLIAPRWNILASELSKLLVAQMMARNIFQGKALELSENSAEQGTQER